MSYDVIAIGSATIDVFADTHSQLVKFITNSGENDFIAYPSGAKILISVVSSTSFKSSIPLGSPLFGVAKIGL